MGTKVKAYHDGRAIVPTYIVGVLNAPPHTAQFEVVVTAHSKADALAYLEVRGIHSSSTHLHVDSGWRTEHLMDAAGLLGSPGAVYVSRSSMHGEPIAYVSRYGPPTVIGTWRWSSDPADYGTHLDVDPSTLDSALSGP